MSSEKSTNRPHRLARTQARGLGAVADTPAPAQPKAKNETDLEYLLTHPKSRLTTMDITDILNHQNFLNLSADSQQALCALLPPTAFTNFVPTLDASHSAMLSKGESTKDPGGSQQSPTALDPTFSSNSFFLSGAKTFQDHIFSSWMTKKYSDTRLQYEEGVRDGSMHAEWKDEEWGRNHPPLRRNVNLEENDLVDLASRSLLQLGDVLLYRRAFASGRGTTVVEKVHYINPLSYAVDFLLASANTLSLPRELLLIDPSPPQPPTLTMERIMSSLELEESVLDVDGRVSRADRNGHDISMTFYVNVRSNAQVAHTTRTAKALTVWRWRDEMKSDFEMQLMLDKAGRELVGTVYYLRRA